MTKRNLIFILFFLGFIINWILSIKFLNTSNNFTLFWEAESADSIVDPFKVESDTTASNDKYVSIYFEGVGKLIYNLWIDKPGKYTLWGRCKWLDGCQDAVIVSINSDHQSSLGNDANYNIWHWVKGSSYNFHKGYNKIVIQDLADLQEDSRSVQVDSFLLTSSQKNNIKNLIKSMPQTDGKIRFNDDFDESMKNWTVFSGSWNLRESSWITCHVEQTRIQRSILLTGEAYWKNYSFQAAVRFVEKGSIGLLFYYQDPNKYYLTRIITKNNTETIQIVKIAGNKEYILAEDKTVNNTNQWYLLRIEILGDQIHVLKNNRKILDIDDNNLDKGRIGLFTDGMKGGAFDDVEVSSINRFSASSFVGFKTEPHVLVKHHFDSKKELKEWKIVRGNWQIEKGSLKGSVNKKENRKPMIIHNYIIHGFFDIEIKANLFSGSGFSLLILDSINKLKKYCRFSLQQINGKVAVIGDFKENKQIRGKEIELEGKKFTVTLKRRESEYSFYINGLLSLANKAPWNQEPAQFGIELDQSILTLESYKVSKVTTCYYYSAWKAPVEWKIKQGRIIRGHVYLSAVNQGEDTILWNKNNFDCKNLTFETELFVSGVVPQGSFLEIIACNDGDQNINGYGLKIEFIDPYNFLSFQYSRKTRITLARNNIEVASSIAYLQINENRNAINSLIRFRKENNSLKIYLNEKEIIRYTDSDPQEGQKLGLLFSPINDIPRDLLGINFFRVFSDNIF